MDTARTLSGRLNDLTAPRVLFWSGLSLVLLGSFGGSVCVGETRHPALWLLFGPLAYAGAALVAYSEEGRYALRPTGQAAFVGLLAIVGGFSCHLMATAMRTFGYGDLLKGLLTLLVAGAFVIAIAGVLSFPAGKPEPLTLIECIWTAVWAQFFGAFLVDPSHWL